MRKGLRDSPFAHRAGGTARAGSGAAGVACRGPGSRPPFAWSSETFGSYKTKGAARACLYSYSDFLLSETALRGTGRRPAVSRTSATPREHPDGPLRDHPLPAHTDHLTPKSHLTG
ncbi:hypothetical protein Saso_68450 [Streptomyces asoensis]|uniref:Uncharacterized protein n=1 Tax=Streptomyces asoensis TaxID=249586 RepID=A0ABQ3SAP7_9ACTN|nr:hypothetical protein GCM10010496_60470 [Streptomyces asoensis]GHI65195.1 hypothetical protein Saso_68450 [Streptomyces asoensis]